MWIRFMAFLATVIFIATGGIMLFALWGYGLTVSDITSFIEASYTAYNTRPAVIAIGIGLLALGLFNVYLCVISLGRKSFVVVRGSAGRIQIAYRSIEELVENAGRDIGGINKISTRVIPRRRKISLEIRLFLAAGKNAIDIAYRLQDLVKEEIHTVLGITNLGEVEVVVRGIAVTKKKRYEDILEGNRASRGIELGR